MLWVLYMELTMLLLIQSREVFLWKRFFGTYHKIKQDTNISFISQACCLFYGSNSRPVFFIRCLFYFLKSKSRLGLQLQKKFFKTFDQNVFTLIVFLVHKDIQMQV